MALLANRRSVMSLYSESTDPCSHAVRFVLSEKAINVEIQYVTVDDRPEDLNDLNPYNTILTLVDRELVLVRIERPGRVARDPARGAQPEPPAVVVRDGRDVRLEHGANRTTGAVVHPVVKLEVADGELGVIDEGVERVELGLVDTVVQGDLGVEALERVEVALLVRLVERLAEMQIARTLGEGRRGNHERHCRHGGSNAPSNLVVLCHTCHENVHRGYLKILGNPDSQDLLFTCAAGFPIERGERSPPSSSLAPALT